VGSINWTDVLKGATAFFLVVAGIGTAYVCVRLGGLFARLSRTVRSMTDEVVPILTRAQTTVDGINLELVRVDDIMVTAVNATKGAEKTVSTISGAVAAPVRKASSLAALAKEAMATFRTRRAAGSDEAEEAARVAAAQAAPEPPPSPEALAAEQFRSAATAAGERFKAAVAEDRAHADAQQPVTSVGPSPPPLRDDPFARHIAPVATSEPTGAASVDGRAMPDAERSSLDGASGTGDGRSVTRRGPSFSQISWALPKRAAR
jgi:hypothetical protein